MTRTTHLAVTRVLDAPRALVFQAFTDPEHLAKWWGPVGNSLPREDMHFDVRSGGRQRWTEVFAGQPEAHVRIDFELTEVRDGELLDGVMSVDGHLPGGFRPFTSRLRVEFHEEGARRTRLEIQQWLPSAVAAPAEQGWGESLSKLEAALSALQNTTINNDNEKGPVA